MKKHAEFANQRAPRSPLSLMLERAARSLLPADVRNPAEWADKYRTLPASSAEPGAYRSSRTPYLVPVLEAYSNPLYRTIVLMCGSQMAKTDGLLLNVIGFRMSVLAKPVMLVFPSQHLAESVSRARLRPMLRSTPMLWEKVDKSRSRLRTNEMLIGGQPLAVVWAGSPIELSSRPVHTVLFDERDLAEDLPGQGDPLSLASARVATFADSKIVVTGTPTAADESAIAALYEAGTKFRWTWPCPRCSAYFAPEYKLLKWDPGSPAVAKRTAKLLCPNPGCGALIEDRHRTAMNSAGHYELTGDSESDCASYWVSGLCSPWRSWGAAAAQWVEAAHSRDQGSMRTVMNSVFGETFALAGEAPKSETVRALRGGYAMDELPAAALGLTAGGDVSENCIYVGVRAWGAGMTSWLITSEILWGDTSQRAVWDALAQFREKQWGARGMRIRLMLIDSGYRAPEVYEFCRRFPPDQVVPTKGRDRQATPIMLSAIDLDRKGNAKRRGTRLMLIDTNHFKSWVHSHCAIPAGETGSWNLPYDCSNDFCDQITSESRIVKPNRSVVWLHSKHIANHWFDVETLNAAAAHRLNVHLIPLSKSPTTAADPATGDPAPQGSPPTEPSSGPSQQPRKIPNPMLHPGFGRLPGASNWVTNWRK